MRLPLPGRPGRCQYRVLVLDLATEAVEQGLLERATVQVAPDLPPWTRDIVPVSSETTTASASVSSDNPMAAR